jgi:hypothetical protein
MMESIFPDDEKSFAFSFTFSDGFSQTLEA